MRKIGISLLILITISTYARADSSPKEYNIPKGAIERIGPNKSHGVDTKEYFLDDELVGRKAFYPNGQVSDLVLFSGGKQHGYHRGWYEMGHPTMKFSLPRVCLSVRAASGILTEDQKLKQASRMVKGTVNINNGVWMGRC